jgi:Ca2+-binding EF-hand superfamily protein
MRNSTITTTLFLLGSFAATQALSISTSISKDARYAQHFLNQFDQNGDGKVSLAELPPPEYSLDMMIRMDTNHDGFIDVNEAKNAYRAKKSIMDDD